MNASFSPPPITSAVSIALHSICLLRKLGTGKSIAFHVQGIKRALGFKS